ncbi:MAG: DNA-directed RNA polymerase subunit N [Candidatus Nanoarchaeia archaeon]
MIPIRCYSCGKPVAHLWEKYKEKVANNEDAKEALDELGLARFCCRQTFLSHVELVDIASKFKKF